MEHQHHARYGFIPTTGVWSIAVTHGDDIVQVGIILDTFDNTYSTDPDSERFKEEHLVARLSPFTALYRPLCAHFLAILTKVLPLFLLFGSILYQILENDPIQRGLRFTTF